jgi:hypothetical protein
MDLIYPIVENYRKDRIFKWIFLYSLSEIFAACLFVCLFVNLELRSIRPETRVSGQFIPNNQKDRQTKTELQAGFTQSLSLGFLKTSPTHHGGCGKERTSFQGFFSNLQYVVNGKVPFRRSRPTWSAV